MSFLVFAAVMVGFAGGDDRFKDDPTRKEAEQFIETVEALQQPVDDFRCEFEGTIRRNRMAAKLDKIKIDAEGLYEAYNGIFIWRRRGDIYMDTYRRSVPFNTISRQTVAVRLVDGKAEQYNRSNDGTSSTAIFNSPMEFILTTRSFPLYLFSIVYLRHGTLMPETDYWFEDSQIDGRPLRVLNVGLGSRYPRSVFDRYWVDLKRTGQVHRRECFDPEKGRNRKRERTVQSNIKLASFQVDGKEIWMPVSGEEQYYSIKNPDTGKFVNREYDPWQIDTIHIVDGTMEINKHPGPEVFTIKYKPGTRISDNLRKVQYEYGQQKVPASLTKAGAEKLLNEQLVAADEQKATLVVAPTAEDSAWTTWMAWGFGGLVAITSVLLWLQRRGR